MIHTPEQYVYFKYISTFLQKITNSRRDFIEPVQPFLTRITVLTRSQMKKEIPFLFLLSYFRTVMIAGD